MRRSLPLLFALALLLIAGPAHAQVEKEVSDVTGVTRISSQELNDITIQTYAGNDAAIGAEYESDPETGETTWSIKIYGFADEATSLSTATQVFFQIGGQQVQPLQVETKTRSMGDDTVLEVKTTTFSRTIFERIATAPEVSLAIGAARFDLSERSREDLRDILNMVPAADTSRTASSAGGR